MFEKLYVLNTTVMVSTGQRENADILFGIRNEKPTIYIIEIDGNKVTHAPDIATQIPLIERACINQIDNAKKLN